MEEAIAWMETHPGLASWVQAVGSIIALGVAIWLAGIPIWSQQRALIENRRVHARRAARAARLALKYARAGVRLAQDGYAVNTGASPIRRAGMTIDQFPTFELEDDLIAEGLEKLRAIFLAMIEATSYGGNVAPPEVVKDLVARLGDAEKVLAEVEEDLGKI